MKFYILYFILITSPIFSNQLVLKYYLGNAICKTIHCTDSVNCFIMDIADDNADPVEWGKGSNKIYKSTDQGNTWFVVYSSKSILEQIKNDPPVLIEGEDVSFPNQDYYFMVFDEEGFIQKSNDGGKTHKKINMNDKLFWNIEMLDTNIGVAYSYLGNIYLTYDSWKTWEIHKTPTLNDSIYLSGFGNPFFRGKGTISALGLILSQKDSSYISSGIFNWDYKNDKWSYAILQETEYDSAHQIPINPRNLFFINDSIGFICGFRKTGIGDAASEIIYKTINGGKTWEKIFDNFKPEFSAWGLQDISFKDELNGVAVGAIGVVLVTGDGGETWEYMNKPDTLLWRQPLTAIVTWAGDYPIIGTYGAGFWRIEGPNGEPPVFKKAVSPPIIQVENNDFGNYDIKNQDSLSKILKVYNISDDSDLKIAGYSVFTESAFSTDLPVTDSLNPITIEPNKFFEYTVYFKPDEVRKYSDSIVFYSNAKDSDNVAVLTGEGIDDTTSVKDYKNNNYFYFHQPYPQPATDEVLSQFSCTEKVDIENINISIYDIFGNEIDINHSININRNTSNSGILKWECTKVVSGTYYIKISDGSDIRMLKVIVYK